MKKLLFLFPVLFCLNSQALIGSKIKSAQSGNGLIGIWENNEYGFNMTLILKEGEEGEFDGSQVHYKTGDGTLSITDTNGAATNYHYELNGNLLVLSGGDLEKATTFKKRTQEMTDSPSASRPDSTIVSPQEKQGINESLIGCWQGANEFIEYRPNGTMTLNGYELTYSVNGNQLIVNTPDKKNVFQYQISGNTMTVVMNGMTTVYQKVQGQNTLGNQGMMNVQNNSVPAQPQDASGLQGQIAPELVGKWCYFSSSSAGSSGSWSTERSITLYANGTYEYYYSSGGSANGYDSGGNQTYASGTQGQNCDRGQWRVQGNVINVISNTNGYKSYTFEKRNNKNGDPMIIVDGEQFVTYSPRNPW